MHRVLVCVSLLLAACGDATNGVTPDAGSDPRVDASSDERPFPLPVFRIGPRSAFGGGFGPFEFTGTIRLPTTTRDFTSFSGWRFYAHGPGPGVPVTLSSTTVAGTDKVATFTISVTTASTAPREAREVFTAISPDESITLFTVLAEDSTLSFTLASTARQAILRARVRSDDPILEDAYYWGAAAQDDAALDDQVDSVASAMATSLEANGSNGISPSGFPRSESPVFSALDAAVATSGTSALVVEPPPSQGHVGVVRNTGAGHFALWLGDHGPSPTMTVPPGTADVGFFFGTTSLTTDTRVHARMLTAAGQHTPASQVFQIATASSGPTSPTLSWNTGAVRACGLAAASWALFIAPQTELAVGFAAAQAGHDGCAELPTADVPAAVTAVAAYEVTAQRAIGLPSETALRP
jgi:hypothetical protein